MGLGLETVVGALLMVGARVSALMVFAPFFGEHDDCAPHQGRLRRGPDGPPLPRRGGGFTRPLRCHAGGRWPGGEFVVGLIMGITLQFVFEGVELAGQIVGFQVGHSLANLINPHVGCRNADPRQFLPSWWRC